MLGPVCSLVMRHAAAIVMALFALTPARADASCIGTTVEQVAKTVVVPTQDPNTSPRGALVVVSPLETDVAPLPNRGDELALRVATLIAGKIPNAQAAPRTMTIEQARAAASRSAMLVYVHVQLQKSQLRVTLDAYPVIRNVWDRARLPAPPPTGHAYAAAPIDAEVRAFFPALPLELTAVHKASHAEGDVLAAACGDLDGDGGAELMLVNREHAVLGRARGTQLGVGRFDVEKSVAWSTLAKRSPVPLREPLAGAEITMGRALIGTSDRGGVIVDDSLALVSTMPGLPLGAGQCATVSPARLSFDGATTACESSEQTKLPAFDAASAFDLVGKSGTESLAVASREGSKLRLRVGGIERASFDGAGAQVAVFDADLDGSPEIAFSSDASDDVITIATIPPQGGSRILNRIAAPAGVRALAACPSQGGGTAAVVAVVGNEVWIVR